MEGSGSGGGGIRLHVGGLGESVGRDDLLKIFSPMGSVDAVEFVRTKGRSFAYIDFSPSSEKSLTKLFSTYNGCKWKGGRLRLEKAKEHYLARLKREWEEAASASDDTVKKTPDNSTPSTHLNIYFPRFRKVKAMPLSGTGKHKYSFQRVAVPSLLPKTFCDCEEHSTSLTPQETHARDLEALNVGINEEEVSVMNSVMNKLFKKNNIVTNEKENIVNNDEDNIIFNDKDNIVINVVSNGKDMMDTELDILSRKRKSILDETPVSGKGYTEGTKGNHIHPSKKKQSIIAEGSGRQEASQPIREKKKPSDVVPEKSSENQSRTTGVKRSNDSISWSQKSSWKALVANGNSSNFSVSSFLPGVVQPTSGNNDLAGLPGQESSEESDVPSQEGSEESDVPSQEGSEESDVPSEEGSEESDVHSQEGSEESDVHSQEGSEESDVRSQASSEESDVPSQEGSESDMPSQEGSEESDVPSQEGSEESDIPTSTARLTVKTKIRKTKCKRLTSTIMAGSVPVADDIERNDTTATDAVGSEHSEDTVAADINVDAEPLELAASTEGDSEDDDLTVEKDENVAEDLNEEKESLPLNDNVDHDVDEEEKGKGPLKACTKSTGGSSWLQRASWTQLVRDKDASFSITQLFPNLASEKREAATVNNNGDGQFSNFNQKETGVKQRDYSCSTNGDGAAGVLGDSSTPLRSLEENRQILKAKNVSEGRRLGAKKPIRREIGSGDTCAFMRSETSLNEWRKAKKALSEPRRKKTEA